ncbi:MAG: hypothetical protein DRN06_07060, partial [Thermoprotei archaeon]
MVRYIFIVLLIAFLIANPMLTTLLYHGRIMVRVASQPSYHPPGARSGRGGPSPASIDMLSYEIRIEEPEIVEIDDGHLVRIPGCAFTSEPGEPALPVKTVLIVLPPSSSLDHIEVESVESRELPGEYDVVPAPEPGILGEEPRPVTKDPGVYGQSEPYPGTLFYYQPKVHMWRGYKLVLVSLYPVQYVPAEKKLIFHGRFRIKVYLTPGTPTEARPDERMLSMLREEALNPEVLDEYEEASGGDPGYLIITRPMFEDAANELKELVEDRYGYNVYIEYVDDIVGEYTGNDTPERIRNCIKDYYNNYYVRYILLLGDCDPTDVDTDYELDVDWEVPTRYVYNPDDDEGYDEYYTGLPNDLTPTDYYYAGLDGDWDDDGDGQYGESSVYSSTGYDEADWLAEVWVGRLPVRSAEDAEDYVAKLQAYLDNLKMRYKRMLLLGAHLFDTDPNDYTDGAWACEKAAEFFPPEVAKRRLYENEDNLTYSNVVSEINTYDPIFVCSASHGSTGKLWLYWTYDWFADTELPEEVSGSGLIWYALACLSGAFDIDEVDKGECFSEAMIRDPDGSSVAHLASTRIAWGYVGSYWFLRGLSGMHLWLFWYYMSLYEDYGGPGYVLYWWADWKYYFEWYSYMYQEYHRKTLFGYMLCGDPALPCSVGWADYEGAYKREIGDEVPVYGYGFVENAAMSIYLQRFDWTTYELERISVGSTTTDEYGHFYTLITVPATVNVHQYYYFMVSDERGNFDYDWSIYIKESLLLTPNRGHGNFIVNATGIGFSPDSDVELRMNNVLIATAHTDENGTFCVFFIVPTANPGIYDVRARDGAGYEGEEPLYVIDVSPLSVDIDVGSIHFAGEVAEFYVLTAFNGTRVDIDDMEALLYYGGSMIVNLTSSVEHIDTGLYMVSYTIPADAGPGTYTLLVEALYTTDIIESRGVAIRSFLISPTLTGWNATLAAIRGDVAVIKTDVGIIKMNLTEIRAIIEDIQGDVATIMTEVGEIEAKLDTIMEWL